MSMVGWKYYSLPAISEACVLTLDDVQKMAGNAGRITPTPALDVYGLTFHY
jgi:hypothetical protein